MEYSGVDGAEARVEDHYDIAVVKTTLTRNITSKFDEGVLARSRVIL